MGGAMSSVSIRRLAALELFAGCRRTTLERADQLGTTVDVPAGRTLCKEGESGTEFFVLLDGEAQVRTEAGTVAMIRPGAWFGETALIDSAPRRATVTTTTPATVIVFGKREFNGLLSIAPSVRSRLEKTTSRVIDGEAPTRQPWYQPLARDFSPRIPYRTESWSEA
jgi:CRP/FNR family transcriptional regulator, cyclic AMP receptor protein